MSSQPPKQGQGEQAPETLLTVASLGLIAEHLTEPLYAKDRQLRFALVNSAYCKLVDRPREALLGKTHTEAFGGEDPSESAKDSAVFETNAPVSGGASLEGLAAAMNHPTGTRLPIADSGGRVTHVVCVISPQGAAVASREQLQEELERYAQQRTEALRSVQEHLLRKERLMVLGQLAAGLAHQIRNPLGAISNAIALARRQVAPNQTIAVEALKIANEEIWEANRIITDLLDYARIRPPSCSDIQLRRPLQEALTMEPLPDQIDVQIDVGDVTVNADPAQVRDALRNLIRNAREAMESEPQGRLSFRTRVTTDHVELTIEDTGVGVPEQQRHLLFEPLVSSKPLGIGLGLPTARALITNQSGSLECAASDADGARFVIRLPRRATPEEKDQTHVD